MSVNIPPLIMGWDGPLCEDSIVWSSVQTRIIISGGALFCRPRPTTDDKLHTGYGFSPSMIANSLREECCRGLTG